MSNSWAILITFAVFTLILGLRDALVVSGIYLVVSAAAELIKTRGYNDTD